MPAEIEPATVRFVTQHPNHCATAVPHIVNNFRLNKSKATKLYINFQSSVVDVQYVHHCQWR